MITDINSEDRRASRARGSPTGAAKERQPGLQDAEAKDKPRALEPGIAVFFLVAPDTED
jgi:hypothetical protein